MNLLEETLDFFRPSYNPEENIYGIVTSMGIISWEDFKKIAKNDEYNDSYGYQEVAIDLMIFHKNGILVRKDFCDGAEGWENIYMNFDKFNLGPADISKIKTFVGACWNSLNEINEDKNEN